ncbi:hypothetical protein LMG31506_05448 [Cupriavidus yeoncheonensis]|uniref:Uncharacterized protein n=1 Tax=Cupriavidus yeoncheonensis TaxID=1462994 RepID=A0A916IZ56_9BURK|nr:hypothetical protein [Cupriavidus yeoncheonensis]CAG2155549.1 hypothetical protein LMG31506_05448 [Cupriavidus yeoncheonensis]
MGDTISKSKRPLHRGAPNDIPTFAKEFLTARLEGFRKDMQICLTGVPAKNRSGTTHAYFPALMTCCAMLEYLAGFYVGRIRGLGRQDVAAYAAIFLPQPDYDNAAIRILFDAFRNTVNHRGIASGVWIDQNPMTRGRRLTWKLMADAKSPALRVVEENGEIKYDSPWPCRYTYRAHIHLGRLWRDIENSVEQYIGAIAADQALQSHFEQCMRQMYPR